MINDNKLLEMQLRADTCRSMIEQFIETAGAQEVKGDPGALMAWMTFKQVFSDMISLTEEHRVLQREKAMYRDAINQMPGGGHVITLLESDTGEVS